MSTTRRTSRLVAGAVAALSLAATTLAATTLSGVVPARADTSPPEVFGYYDSHADNPGQALLTYLRLMAVPSTSTGFSPTVTTPRNDPARACPASRCQDVRVPVPAGVRIADNRVRVLLPAGYRKSDRRYPVVYMFTAGATGYDGYTDRMAVTEITRTMPAIFVMPDGGRGANLGMFSNWVDKTWQYETYHTSVLPAYVDRHFRTLPGERAAVGNSVAGLGALSYAARHRGLYRSVLSISGLVDNYQFVDAAAAPQDRLYPSGFPQLSRVWGDPVADADIWNAHNPTALAPRLKGVDLFISSGTGYSTGGTEVSGASGFLEQYLWTGHRAFLDELTRAKIPYEARLAQGNAHGFPWFDRPMRWGLAKLMADFAQPRG